MLNSNGGSCAASQCAMAACGLIFTFNSDTDRPGSSSTSADTITSARDWLAGDADARPPDGPDVAAGFACDAAGCVARLADGSAVAVARTVDAFADDCARAALIVALRAPPEGCRATVIDRATLVAAQQQPDDYKDLIVRVAGYSDHFHNLSKELQDEIIERTEQSFH